MCIALEDAQAYAQWLTEATGKQYRLPTEAEWEYAGRGGTTTPLSFTVDSTGTQPCAHANGADQSLGNSLNKQWDTCMDGYAFTAPVAEFKANAYRLNDMHGNAWEWTQDCYHESYRGAPEDGRAWLDANDGNCSKHVLRGGSWSLWAEDLRSANRLAAQFVSSEFGFRLARSL